MMLEFLGDERARAVDALHLATSIYTRNPVVRALLDTVHWPETGSRLLDPSGGDGAIIIEALERLALRPGADLSSILGIEIHPDAVRQARQQVAALLMRHGWGDRDARHAAQAVIRQGDFLTAGVHQDAGSFDLVVGNPPYRRWANVPMLLRDCYEPRVPRAACADMLHAFLDACVAILPEHGRMALVTADRWQFNDGAAGLRAAIGCRFGIGQVDRLDVTSAFYGPKNRKRGSLPRVHPVAVTLQPATRASIRLDARPVRPGAAPAIATGQRLCDIADVRIAPWLGPHGVFVVDRAQGEALIDDGARLMPAVDTDDIEREREFCASRGAWRS